MKATLENYRDKRWFSLNGLADLMGEFTNDGRHKDVGYPWLFLAWLDRKCRPQKVKPKKKTK